MVEWGVADVIATETSLDTLALFEAFSAASFWAERFFEGFEFEVAASLVVQNDHPQPDYLRIR